MTNLYATDIRPIDMGAPGVDGKYGPLTHAALERFTQS